MSTETKEYIVSGTVHHKGEKESFPTKKGDEFTKQLLVIDTNEKFNQYLPVEFTQDRCDLLDGVRKGDEVKVYLNLGGREWTKDGKTRYFPSIDGWKLERLVDSSDSAGNSVKIAIPEVPENEPVAADDDLPF
jgi:hypothetical protein